MVMQSFQSLVCGMRPSHAWRSERSLWTDLTLCLQSKRKSCHLRFEVASVSKRHSGVTGRWSDCSMVYVFLSLFAVIVVQRESKVSISGGGGSEQIAMIENDTKSKWAGSLVSTCNLVEDLRSAVMGFGLKNTACTAFLPLVLICHYLFSFKRVMLCPLPLSVTARHSKWERVTCFDSICVWHECNSGG